MELNLIQNLRCVSFSSSRPSEGVKPYQVEKEKKYFVCQALVKDDSLFAGRSDGMIICWKLDGEGKESILGTHGGAVHCIAYCEGFGPSGLLFSGSADRTIKAWIPHPVGREDPVVQTLSGHGGTVTCLAFGDGFLISGSSDRTIKIWAPDASRVLLLHPWFNVVQNIDFGQSWPMSISVRPGEYTVYVGDSDGIISVYEQAVGRRGGGGGGITGNGLVSSSGWTPLALCRRYTGQHRLGVTHMLLVSEQNYLITLSSDGHLRVFDALGGSGVSGAGGAGNVGNNSAFFLRSNPQRVRYTGMAWNPGEQELFVVDQLGFCYVYSIFADKIVKTMRLRDGKLTSAILHARFTRLLVSGEESCDEWRVNRDLKFVELTAHREPVLGIVVAPPAGAAGQAVGSGLGAMGTRGAGSHRIFSASLDNSILCWDPYDMTPSFTLNELVSEISCFMYLPVAGLLVTGLEDGSVKWWNPDSGSTVTLREHKNTVSALAYAPGDRQDFLLSGGYDGMIGIWDVTNRRSLKPRVEYLFNAHDGDEPEILCLCFADLGVAGRVLFSGGNDTLVKLWSVGAFELEGILEGHTGAVTCCAVDGVFAFTGSDDLSIRIWNVARPRSASDKLDVVHRLKNILAYASVPGWGWLGRVCDRDGCTGSTLSSAHSQSVRDLLVLPGLGFLVSCAFDGKIKVWDYGDDSSSGGGLDDIPRESVAITSEEKDATQPRLHGSGRRHGDAAIGRVLTEFTHGDEFRCISYRYVPSKLRGGGGGASIESSIEILAGTEQSRILLFQIPQMLVSQRRNASPSASPRGGRLLSTAVEVASAVVPGGALALPVSFDAIVDLPGPLSHI